MRVSDHVTLKGIDLTVFKGEFVAIIGEVGSGKSSIINTMCGDMLLMNQQVYDKHKDKSLSQSVREEEKDVVDEIKQDMTDSIDTHVRNDRDQIIINGKCSLIEQVPWIQSMTI